jgi:hypothetical protein
VSGIPPANVYWNDPDADALALAAIPTSVSFGGYGTRAQEVATTIGTAVRVLGNIYGVKPSYEVEMEFAESPLTEANVGEFVALDMGDVRDRYSGLQQAVVTRVSKTLEGTEATFVFRGAEM